MTRGNEDFDGLGMMFNGYLKTCQVGNDIVWQFLWHHNISTCNANLAQISDQSIGNIRMDKRRKLELYVNLLQSTVKVVDRSASDIQSLIKPYNYKLTSSTLQS